MIYHVRENAIFNKRKKCLTENFKMKSYLQRVFIVFLENTEDLLNKLLCGVPNALNKFYLLNAP